MTNKEDRAKRHRADPEGIVFTKKVVKTPKDKDYPKK